MLDPILSKLAAAKAVGFSLATLERVIARGDGPPVIQLSPRRQGIRESDLNKWLNDRVRDVHVNGVSKLSIAKRLKPRARQGARA